MHLPIHRQPPRALGIFCNASGRLSLGQPYTLPSGRSASATRASRQQTPPLSETPEVPANDGRATERGNEPRQPELSTSGKPIGWKLFPKEKELASRPKEVPDVPPHEPSGSGRGVGDELPPASRGQVFWACAQTSLLLGGLALFLRSRAAQLGPAALHTDPAAVQRLLTWPEHVDPSHVAVMLGCAMAVTGARQVLLGVWPAFAQATDRSNAQVMSNLQPWDLVWVAALSGCSEELLFRGALIPSLYPDWRGVVIAGIGFGLLHNSGGRNLAFASWASVVGTLYGAAFLGTGDVLVPMCAHSLANFASGRPWLQAQQAKK